MQYYIRGAWRTISDRQPVDRRPVLQAETASHRQGEASASTPKDSHFPATSGQRAASYSNRAVVKRELSQEMKQSSDFLRDTEGEWEAILRRMSARDGEDSGGSQGSGRESGGNPRNNSQQHSQASA